MIVMVKSEKIYSPQNYLEIVTGNCYLINGDDDVGLTECILEKQGYGDLWSYPLTEIDHIVENKLDVVLVDCMVYDEESQEYKHEYRWFEVPEDFEDMEDDEYVPSAENGDYSPSNPWDAPGMKMSDFI
jgi:hypothetical protein